MKIGGTSGLGFLAGEGPLSPSMAEESPPPSQPCLLRAPVSGPWGRPGHPLGIGMPEVAAAGGLWRGHSQRDRRRDDSCWPPPVLRPLSWRLQLARVALVWGGMYVILGVAAKERERRLHPGQEVGRPQLRSPVGTPGPAGTGGHRTGSVPNARLYGPPIGGPEGRRPAERVQGPSVVGQNLPEDPPPHWGSNGASGASAYCG